MKSYRVLFKAASLAVALILILASCAPSAPVNTAGSIAAENSQTDNTLNVPSSQPAENVAQNIKSEPAERPLDKAPGGFANMQDPAEAEKPDVQKEPVRPERPEDRNASDDSRKQDQPAKNTPSEKTENTAPSDSKKDDTGAGKQEAVPSEIYISSLYYTNSVDLSVGGSAVIELAPIPENTTEKIAVVWSADTNGAFGIGQMGRGSYYGESSTVVVTGVAGGKGTVTANVTVYDSTGVEDGTATLTSYINVDGASEPAAVVPLTGVALSESNLNLEIRGSRRLSASALPSDTTESTSVSWKSSNSEVATVDQNGLVTGVSEGSAVITATIGGKSAGCNVTVTGFIDNGSYKDASDAYSSVNSFRTDSGNQWYWNEDNISKTETPGLGELSRDNSLEETAKLRAKEAWIQYYVNGKATHTRPDGSNCFTAYPSSLLAMGENLAWGYGSGSSVVDGWAETDKDYNGQGHRRNILNSGFTMVGIACYVKDGKTCWAMCLGR